MLGAQILHSGNIDAINRGYASIEGQINLNGGNMANNTNRGMVAVDAELHRWLKETALKLNTSIAEMIAEMIKRHRGMGLDELRNMFVGHRLAQELAELRRQKQKLEAQENRLTALIKGR